MFNKKKYIETLKHLTDSGLVASTDWHTVNTNTLLLRHDIDFSVEYAHEIAEVEQAEGIASTYFFMMTSNTYNLLSAQCVEVVKSIQKMGHKISLHFDPTCYEDIDAGFMAEKTAFKDIFKTDIDIVSIHRPGEFLNNNNRDLCGCAQTYQDKYFKESTYISDSGGRDVKDKLTSYLAETDRKGLHLLLHPIWWIDNANDSTDTLNRWLGQYSSFLKTEIKRNCKTYEG